MVEAVTMDLDAVKRELHARALHLGFGELGVATVEIPEDERHLLHWLEAGFHGEMQYMQRHGTKRSRPQELVPGTLRVISVRMDYWPGDAAAADDTLADGVLGYVSRYALGRDYHKIMRAALARLAEEMSSRIGTFGYRVCVDSAKSIVSSISPTSPPSRWLTATTDSFVRHQVPPGYRRSFRVVRPNFGVVRTYAFLIAPRGNVGRLVAGFCVTTQSLVTVRRAGST